MSHGCIILADGPGALVGLCGISLIERLLRTLRRCGVTRAIVLSATPDVLAQHLANPSPHRSKVAIEIRGRASGPLTVEQVVEAWPGAAREVLLLRGDYVFDSRLIELLETERSNIVLVDTSGIGAALVSFDWAEAYSGPLEEALRASLENGRIAGARPSLGASHAMTEHRAPAPAARPVAALDLAAHSWYHPGMRRELPPYWLPAPTPENRRVAERVLLDAAQKGTQDFPALVHAPIENFLVSHLCKTAITPNQLTLFSNVVAWGATLLFATGRLAWGTALALAVGILDGLDGKQARLKVETTDAGKLEHWFDALFENSWWIALAWAFQTSGQLPGAFRYLLLLLGAEGAGGLAKWSIIRYRGRLIDELSGFDRAFRLVAGRRNIHVWILAAGVLLGAPARAFVAMASWEAITAAVQIARAGWTLLFRAGDQTSDRR